MTALRMIGNDVCDSLAHTGDEAGVLELANGRVIELVDACELVVAVKVDLPAELGELFGETGFDEADGGRGRRLPWTECGQRYATLSV